MKHPEENVYQHHSVYKEPEGYEKFITTGSSPLSSDVIAAALQEFVAGNKIDIVGIDSIANFQTVS